MTSWDHDLLLLINREWTSPLLDYLMPAMSGIDAWIPLLALMAVIAAFRGGKSGRQMLLCIALALGLTDGVVCKSLKSAVGRVRPLDAMPGVMIRDLGPGTPPTMRLFKPPVAKLSKMPKDAPKPGRSFPSSHTANMFALATVVALFFRRWGMAVFALAAIVAYSRIYVGAHWPSDIPPSMGIGVLIGWATVKIVAAIARRFQKRPA